MQDVEGWVYLGTAEDNLTEEVKVKIMDRYGLSESESSKDNLFQADFGFTINFPILITSAIILVVAGVLLYFFSRYRKI